MTVLNVGFERGGVVTRLERRDGRLVEAFHDNDGGFFTDKQLYLLRNFSKGRGIGFFEAGNFHPGLSSA